MTKRKSKKMTGHPPPEARGPAGEAAGGAKVRRRRLRVPNWPLLALSLAGALLTAYLTLTAWLGDAPLFCAEGSSCDIVQGSRWGTFLGLPTAFYGLLAYLALGHIAYRVRDPARHWKLAWLVALPGLSISLYLTYVSLVVIEAACFYCLISLGLMAAIFTLLFVQHPPGMPGFSWPAWAGETVLLAALLVGGMHLHYSGVFDPSAGPEDPYLRDLAIHLTDSGAVFYGAYW